MRDRYESLQDIKAFLGNIENLPDDLIESYVNSTESIIIEKEAIKWVEENFGLNNLFLINKMVPNHQFIALIQELYLQRNILERLFKIGLGPDALSFVFSTMQQVIDTKILSDFLTEENLRKFERLFSLETADMDDLQKRIAANLIGVEALKVGGRLDTLIASNNLPSKTLDDSGRKRPHYAISSRQPHTATHQPTHRATFSPANTTPLHKSTLATNRTTPLYQTNPTTALTTTFPPPAYSASSWQQTYKTVFPEACNILTNGSPASLQELESFFTVDGKKLIESKTIANYLTRCKSGNGTKIITKEAIEFFGRIGWDGQNLYKFYPKPVLKITGELSEKLGKLEAFYQSGLTGTHMSDILCRSTNYIDIINKLYQNLSDLQYVVLQTKDGSSFNLETVVFGLCDGRENIESALKNLKIKLENIKKEPVAPPYSSSSDPRFEDGVQEFPRPETSNKGIKFDDLGGDISFFDNKTTPVAPQRTPNTSTNKRDANPATRLKEIGKTNPSQLPPK